MPKAPTSTPAPRRPAKRHHQAFVYFDSAKQKESIYRAARKDGRSVSQFILRAVLEKMSRDAMQEAAQS